jgi:hypothetical protein
MNTKAIAPLFFNIIFGIVGVVIIVLLFNLSQTFISEIERSYVTDLQTEGLVDSYVPVLTKLDEKTFETFFLNVHALHASDDSFFTSSKAFRNYEVENGQLLTEDLDEDLRKDQAERLFFKRSIILMPDKLDGLSNEQRRSINIFSTFRAAAKYKLISCESFNGYREGQLNARAYPEVSYCLLKKGAGYE